MNDRWRTQPARALLLVAGVLIAGCTNGEQTVTPPTEILDLREPASAAPGETETGPDEAAPADAPTAEPVEIITEPARRIEENPPVDASNWIARTFMDSNTVELVWSPVDGADTYRLFRLPTVSADYDAIDTGVIDGAEEVYVGAEFGFIDNDPPTGTFLTYVLVAEVDNTTTQPRWTEALTIDDTTPPAPITGLTATTTDSGVLLEWQPSPDDVEFAAYNVSILEEGQLRYIGGGADVGQVSFLDDSNFSGTRTYVVAAVDFHNNVSETAEADVTR